LEILWVIEDEFDSGRLYTVTLNSQDSLSKISLNSFEDISESEVTTGFDCY